MIEELLTALERTPRPGDWARNARCRTAPLSVFFPLRGDDVRQAKEICRICPVLDECRRYGMEHTPLTGVWGGLSEHERKQLRREAS